MDTAEASDAHQLLAAVGSGAALSSQRRVSQSLQLARRLIEAQRDVNSARRDADDVKAHAAELDAQLQKERAKQDGLTQPHLYLVETLQAKDDTVRSPSRDRCALDQAV